MGGLLRRDEASAWLLMVELLVRVEVSFVRAMVKAMTAGAGG